MTHEEQAERRKLIADAVRNGTPVAQAARDAGVCITTAEKACHEHEVKLEGVSFQPVRDSSWDVLEDLLKTDMSEVDIGRNRHISRERVRQIKERAKRAGVDFGGKR